MTIDELLAAIATLSDGDRATLGERLEAARRGRLQSFFGAPGVRDPEAPCEEFVPGTPDGNCGTDGHYMCHECEHAQLCEDCGQSDARCECEGDGSS
jgi:hypothetical protein